MNIIEKIKEEINKLDTTKKVLYGAAVVFLLLIIIIPSLRWIFWTLFLIAAAAVTIKVALKFQKRSNEQMAARLPGFAKQYPLLFKYFALKDSNIATPLPNHLLERVVWRSLPNDLRESEPTLSIAPNFVLSCVNTQLSKQYSDAKAFEDGAIYKALLGGLITMSEKLGVTSGAAYKTITNASNKIVHIIEQDGKHLYTFAGIVLPSSIEAQLKPIAEALNIDYDSAGLGTWDPGRSSYSGRGSWGMIGLGLAMSAGSALNAAGKKSAFNTASIYVAFNNIVDYFNTQYYPDEYDIWKAEQLPAKVKLSNSQAAAGTSAPRLNDTANINATAVKGISNVDDSGLFLITGFRHGVATVLVDKKWGAIDKNASLIAPIDFASIYEFSDGVAAFKRRENSKWGFMDTSGKTILPENYDRAGEYHEGLIPVQTGGENGKWGYIDITGKEILSSIYDFAFEFSEGFAVVHKKDKCGLIDKAGNLVIPYTYDELRPMRNGLLAAKSGKHWGFVDTNNKIAVPFEYGNVKEFHEGLAAVTKQLGANYEATNWGYIDKSGRVVIPFGYYSAENFENGLAPVRFNEGDDETRFIDAAANIIISLPYNFYSSFDKNGCAVSYKFEDSNMKHGVVNKQGKVVVPFVYDQMGFHCEEGLVVAYSNNEKLFYVVDFRADSLKTSVLPGAQKWEPNNNYDSVSAQEQTQILTKE